MPSIIAEIQLSDRLSRAIEKLPAVVEQRMKDFADRVMEASDKVVPEKTGHLRESRFLEIGEDSQGPTVTMGYSADYALAVHENLDPGVHWTRPGSGPKYLETPLKAMQAELPADIAGSITVTFE